MCRWMAVCACLIIVMGGMPAGYRRANAPEASAEEGGERRERDAKADDTKASGLDAVKARIEACLEAMTYRPDPHRRKAPPHCRAVCAELVAIGKPAVPAILQHIEAHNDVESLSPAVEVLKEIGDPRAVPVLLALLDRETVMLYLGYGLDPRRTLKWRVTWALGTLGDVRALPKLKRLAADDARPSHHAAASIRMIEVQNDKDRPGALIGLMKSAPIVNSVRGWAAEKLQPMEDPRINPALIEMLASDDRFLERTVLKVIARRKAVEAVPAVIDLIGTKADLRWVRSALGELVGESPNLSALDYQYNPEKARKAWRKLWEKNRDKAGNHDSPKGGV